VSDLPRILPLVKGSPSLIDTRALGGIGERRGDAYLERANTKARLVALEG
jgi:hypothetical protein